MLLRDLPPHLCCLPPRRCGAQTKWRFFRFKWPILTWFDITLRHLYCPLGTWVRCVQSFEFQIDFIGNAVDWISIHYSQRQRQLWFLIEKIFENVIKLNYAIHDYERETDTTGRPLVCVQGTMGCFVSWTNMGHIVRKPIICRLLATPNVKFGHAFIGTAFRSFQWWWYGETRKTSQGICVIKQTMHRRYFRTA